MSQDKGRFDKAAPHIQALLDCADRRFQGLAHLFAGVGRPRTVGHGSGNIG